MPKTQVDAVLAEHAERLQKVYNERTAGDYSFLGLLGMFLIDVDKVRNQAEIQDWINTVAEFMADDKSNDWSEELTRLAEITGDPDYAPDPEREN